MKKIILSSSIVILLLNIASANETKAWLMDVTTGERLYPKVQKSLEIIKKNNAIKDSKNKIENLEKEIKALKLQIKDSKLKVLDKVEVTKVKKIIEKKIVVEIKKNIKEQNKDIEDKDENMTVKSSTTREIPKPIEYTRKPREPRKISNSSASNKEYLIKVTQIHK